MDRRQFLQIALTSGSVYMLNNLIPTTSASQELANPADERLLFVIRLNGAWDTLMSTDARTSETLNAAAFSDREFLKMDERASVKSFQHGQLGPTMSPLFNNLQDLCIINGLMMDLNSNIHETNREYMSSGNLIKGTTFFPFALAQALKASNEIRIGHRMEYEPLHDGNYINKTPTSNLTSFSNSFTDSYEDVLLDESSAAQMQKTIITQNRNEKEAIDILNQLILKTNDSLSSDKTGYKQVSLALAGLGSGYLKMAQVDMVNDAELDTHGSHRARHIPTLTAAFDHISKIIKFMKETPYKLDPNAKKSLFDMTTVVITSEFSRTTYVEGYDGTSHNQYNNSCILFGSNVRGGTLIGESQIYKKSENKAYDQECLYHASPFDFQTQKALSRQEIGKTPLANIGICKPGRCFDYIYPETIWRTIAAQYGVDSLSSLPPGPLLKALFKS